MKTAKWGTAWVLMVLLGVMLASCQTTGGLIAVDPPVAEITGHPAMVVGDKITYQEFDSLVDAKSGTNQKWTTVDVVTAIKDTGFVMNSKNTTHEYNVDGNMIRRTKKGQLRTYSPFWPLYRYPMKVGDAYKAKFTHTWSEQGDASYDVTVKVIGWEKIAIPAGEFIALRVEMSGSYTHPPNYAPANIIRVEWLAREVKMRPILTGDERWWGGGSKASYTSMQSFSLKQ